VRGCEGVTCGRLGTYMWIAWNGSISRRVVVAWLVTTCAMAVWPSESSAQDGVTTIILVRHAERGADGDDPPLTEAGKQRAALLAAMLKDSGVSAIFTSERIRTKETAAPTAAALKITPALITTDLAKVRAQVQEAGGQTPSRRVLIVGHSNTVPTLIGALGGPKDIKIADDEFDRLFVLTMPASGPSTLLALRYGAAPQGHASPGHK
jgi:phosphohistidine phosphatase SixA